MVLPQYSDLCLFCYATIPPTSASDGKVALLVGFRFFRIRSEGETSKNRGFLTLTLVITLPKHLHYVFNINTSTFAMR